MADDFCMYIHIYYYILLSIESSLLFISRYMSLHVSYSWIVFLLQYEGLQRCSQWLFVDVTKRGFSYMPTSISDIAACVHRTTFPQLITLQQWGILYNEEVYDLFLQTSRRIGGLVICTWDTKTGNTVSLHVSKSI